MSRVYLFKFLSSLQFQLSRSCYPRLQSFPLPDDTEEGEMASVLLGGVGVLVKIPEPEDVFGCMGILLLI